MDFSAIFAAVQANATGAMLVLALLALAYVYREKERVDAAHLETVKAMNAEHLATAMLVAPLASKLADCVVLASQIAATRSGGNA